MVKWLFKKKITDGVFLLGVIVIVLFLSGLYPFGVAQPGEDEEDPPAFLEVYVYDKLDNPVPGVSVRVEVLDGGWVKVDDGSWFGGWGKDVETATDSDGFAGFRCYRFLFSEMKIRVTVNWKYPQSREETISLGWCPIPTHVFEFNYMEHVIPEVPYGTVSLLLASLTAMGLMALRQKKH